MTSLSILSWLAALHRGTQAQPNQLPPRPDLHTLATHPELLPAWVREAPVTQRYLDLLGPLAWDRFPERELRLFGETAPVPYAPFVAACLIKLDQQLGSLGRLRAYLVEHPALVWVLGFPLMASSRFPWGFDVEASLSTQRHFTRMLRKLPNWVLQFLLDSSITLLRLELAAQGLSLGEAISLDTKHILAWVKENNPKTYVKNRFDKTQQPVGDPDCRLGCKRRHNQGASSSTAPATPQTYPQPANSVAVGEFYWGYGSGIVATKVAAWGEFVLAELTQPFDQADVAYFFPLMATTEQRLGFRPKFAAFDAAFDAFYVYDYFDQVGGFAAVPFSERGGYKNRQFSEDGLPRCAAGLPMPLKYAFTDRSTLVEHQRGRYVCPLLFPTATGETCPIHHQRWKKGGCVTTLPLSKGARLRYQLDRQCEIYQAVYRQRTATERVNSQAVALNIERPHLRNGQAIANLNTLIYILINLRALQRIRQHTAELRSTADQSALIA